MIYRVTYTSPGRPPVSDSRRRADAAEYLARRVAYDLIASQGALDLPWGHKAMAAVEGLDVRQGGTVGIGDYTLFVTCSKGT